MQLVWPSQEHLSSYIAALERGWSPNNLRPEAGREELVLIQADPERFLASLVDPEAKGPPVALPDGGTVPRLPGYRRWMWDGEFCGSIQLRWQPGTNALPEYCLGHIGYAVVPWKSGRGYARTALRARAIENQCYLLAVGQGGTHENGRQTHGNSMIIDPWGDILDRKAKGPGVVIADLDHQRIAEIRESLPALAHRKL